MGRPVWKTRWLRPRLTGAPEASLSARSCLRLPRASASLGQPAARAALTGHTGRVLHTGAVDGAAHAVARLERHQRGHAARGVLIGWSRLRFDFFCCLLSCGCPPIQTPYSKFEFGAPCSSRHSSTSFGFEPAHSHNAALKLAGRILDSSPSPSHNLFATRGSIRDDDAASGQCTSHLLHPTSSPRTRGDVVVAEWRRLLPVSTLTFSQGVARHVCTHPAALPLTYCPVVAPLSKPV